MEEGVSISCNSRTTCNERGHTSSHSLLLPCFSQEKRLLESWKSCRSLSVCEEVGGSSAGADHGRHKSVNISYGPRFSLIAQLLECFEQMAFSSDTSAVVSAAWSPYPRPYPSVSCPHHSLARWGYKDPFDSTQDNSDGPLQLSNKHRSDDFLKDLRHFSASLFKISAIV